MTDYSAIIAAVGFSGVILIALSLGSAFTEKVDQNLLDALQSKLPVKDCKARKRLETAMRDVTALGGDTFSAVVLLSGLLVLAADAAAGTIAAFVLTMFGARLAGLAMKKFIKRERPPAKGQAIEIFTSSFPSIHTAMGFVSSFAIVTFLVAGEVTLITALLFAATVSAIIGFTRLYFSVHWPSDVLAGWLLGFAICSSSGFLMQM